MRDLGFQGFRVAKGAFDTWGLGQGSGLKAKPAQTEKP